MAGINIQLTLGGITQATNALRQAAQVMNASAPRANRPGQNYNFMSGDFQQLQKIRDQRARNKTLANDPLIEADLASKEFSAIKRIKNKNHEMKWGWMDDLLKQFSRVNRTVYFTYHSFKILAGAFEALAGPARELAQAQIVGGGSSHGAFGIGRAAGLDEAGTASASVAFHERLASDPLAAMTFGGPKLPLAMGGNQNTFPDLMKAIDRLASIQNENTRIMAARRGGLEAFLSMSYASPSIRKYLADQSVGSDRAIRAGRAEEADISGLNAAAMNDWKMAGTRLARATAPLRGTGAAIFGGFGALAEKLSHGLEWIANTPAALQEAMGGGKQKTEISKNTQAMEDLAGVFRDMGRTIHGGGARTKAAIPEGIKGMRLQQAIHDDALRLGGVAK